MSFIILQLSDLHFGNDVTDATSLCTKLARITSAVAEETTAKSVILLLSGDIINRGDVSSFNVARAAISKLISILREDNRETKVLLVPGNHDCDFQKHSKLRQTVIDSIKSPIIPDDSYVEAALLPLSAYFDFAKELTSEYDAIAIDHSHKLYRFAELPLADESKLGIHLLNSAWLSTPNEKANSITFPIDLIEPLESSSDYRLVIATLHHPLNWFAQPHTMRQLRDRLEQVSDIVFTGHEHVGRTVGTQADGSDPVFYIEGGALNDPSEASVFNIVTVRDEAKDLRIKRYKLIDGSFELEKEVTRPISLVRAHTSTYSIKSKFEKFLSESEFPFARPSEAPRKLPEFYTLPDLRDLESLTSNTNRRIKAEAIYSTIQSNSITMLIGAEKCGRTSLLKAIYRSYFSEGKLPVYVNASQFANIASSDILKRCAGKAIRLQYKRLSFESYCQLEKAKRILLVDDWDRAPLTSEERSQLLKCFESQFQQVVLTSTNNTLSNSVSAEYANVIRRYEICDFGKGRLRELARKWYGAGDTPAERESQRKKIEASCIKVERALRAHSIPHHPWILVSLLQLCARDDYESRKDGSYGHLFNAVITNALQRTNSQLDLTTIYTYLAYLAHHLYGLKSACLENSQLREFHDMHCKSFVSVRPSTSCGAW